MSLLFIGITMIHYILSQRALVDKIYSDKKTICDYIDDQKLIQQISSKPSISFGGAGSLFHFQVGVSQYILDNFNTNDLSVLTVSGGIYSGISLVLSKSSKSWMEKDWKRVHNYYNSRFFKLFLCLNNDFYNSIWKNHLPVDAYQKCTNKLFIGISQWSWKRMRLEQKIIHRFSSNQDLIDAIQSSINIPGLFLRLPLVDNKFGFDGCFTNTQPMINYKTQKFSTMTVKLIGRGSIDYGNKIPITKILKLIDPKESNRLVDEGYQIASQNHHKFVEAGLR